MTSSRPDLVQLSTRELLKLYRELLDELHDRRVVRSRNAPAGDLAETLSALVYGGSLAPPSEKSWDVLANDGRKIQVKCRVSYPGRRGGNFSPFRSDGFDACVFVVLNPDYGIKSAVELPAADVFAIARDVPWVNGRRIRLGQDIRSLPGAVDRTEQFQDAMTIVDSASSKNPLSLSGLMQPEPPA